MCWAAPEIGTRRGAAALAAVAAMLVLGGTEGRAQDYMALSIEGELTPELRAAIAAIVDPGTNHAALIEGFQRAEPAETLVPRQYLREDGAPVWAPQGIDLQGSGPITAPAASLGFLETRPGDRSSGFDYNPTFFAPPNTLVSSNPASAGEGCPSASTVSEAVDLVLEDGVLGVLQSFDLQASGSASIRACGLNAIGFFDTEPDLTIRFSGSQEQSVRFDVRSPCDAVMLIQSGAGNWVFNDDGGNDLNPMLVLSARALGDEPVAVWLGSYGRQGCDATLDIAADPPASMADLSLWTQYQGTAQIAQLPPQYYPSAEIGDPNYEVLLPQTHQADWTLSPWQVSPNLMAANGQTTYPGPTIFPPPRFPQTAETGTGFLFAESGSDFALAYGGPQVRQSVEGDALLGVPLTLEDVSSGLTTDGTAATDLFFRGNFELSSAPIRALAHAERNLERFGAAQITISIDPDASPEAVQTAMDLGRGVRTADSGVIDTPDGAVIQSASSGACELGHRDWPFSADEVAAVIRHNRAVLHVAGIRHPARTRILVVDSGLPGALARHEGFRRFLFSDAGRLLRDPGFSTNTAGREICATFDGDYQGQNAFGVVATDEMDHNCAYRNQLGWLAPPPADPRDATYHPGHGGFVAALAAGGPALLAADHGIDELIGIGFARIAWRDPPSGEGAYRVRSDSDDVRRAVEYAMATSTPILNVSLRIPENHVDKLSDILTDYGDDGGLIVAAAGNSRGVLHLGDSVFPASLAIDSGNENLIIVGGVHRPSTTEASVAPWAVSASSPSLVDIAAPAADIISFGLDGREACFSGTSAAAPQVSFVAGLLASYGYPSAMEINRRILATADHLPALEGRVSSGRVLNVATALDVFADLVWLTGQSDPIRGEIVSGQEGFRPMLQLCDDHFAPLYQTRGLIDVNRLQFWRRTSETTATIWHHYGQQVTGRTRTCDIPADASIEFVTYRNGETVQQTFTLADIDRIVPSRLRAFLSEALAMRGGAD